MSPVPPPVSAFETPREPAWGVRTEGLPGVLEGWLGQPRVQRQLTLAARLPARGAQLGPVPSALAPAVVRALSARGIHELYSHQRACVEHALAGRDVVVATPTASGKSLCYHLPVLHALATDEGARALYLFPTKALSRDQEVSLRALLGDAGLGTGAITYDGDTPADARRAARERAGVLITNPDMLHAGILPHHTNWARFFAKLRYVVIDELHAYRGVFGSHLANVVRRLLRVARFHGSEPVLLLASATIGNPGEHASRLAGRPAELVADNGAPQGARRLLVYNPPVLNAELGIRESYLKAAVRLSSDLVGAGVSTLVFGQSRNNVEVMLKYLRERLAKRGVPPERIAAYRGGYLPELRRSIEQALREGQLSCVVATSALELGIDIGALDAVVCAGFPGSFAGLWQRFGRAGRRGGESLALLVSSSAPLDQYVALGGEQLLTAPIEQARIDPDNAEILVQHVKCAAFELPFERGEAFGDVPPDVVGDALEYLSQHGLLHAVHGARGKVSYHWASDAYPASHVSLRSVGFDNFAIIDVEREASIAEMDFRSAHTMLHEQAIYQHEGEQYQVERLDFENHKAFVRKVASDYFTDAMTYVQISVLERAEERTLGESAGEAMPELDAEDARALVGHGDVSAIEKVVGYKKIKYHTHENLGYGEVDLPEMQMHTTAFWLTVPEGTLQRLSCERPMAIDALRGLGRALHTVASVGLMTDPSDLGHTLGDRADGDSAPSKARGGPQLHPTLFVYDRMPGGVGLAPRLYAARDELLRRARALLQACPCPHGCPACVGPVIGAESADASSLPLRKRLAIALLAELGVPRVQ